MLKLLKSLKSSKTLNKYKLIFTIKFNILIFFIFTLEKQYKTTQITLTIQYTIDSHDCESCLQTHSHAHRVLHTQPYKACFEAQDHA